MTLCLDSSPGDRNDRYFSQRSKTFQLQDRYTSNGHHPIKRPSPGTPARPCTAWLWSRGMDLDLNVGWSKPGPHRSSLLLAHRLSPSSGGRGALAGAPRSKRPLMQVHKTETRPTSRPQHGKKHVYKNRCTYLTTEDQDERWGRRGTPMVALASVPPSDVFVQGSPRVPPILQSG